MKAVTCPVCYGKGKLDIADGRGVKQNGTVCWGCNGKGWVEVKEDCGFYPYLYPYLYYPYYPHYVIPEPTVTFRYSTGTNPLDTGTL